MNLDNNLIGITSSPDTAALTKDLAAAQSEYPPIAKTGENKFGKYWYLTYAGICEALVGPLTKHNLALPQICLTRVGGDWIAVGTLRHTSGQFITSLCPLYMAKQDMQSLGSAYTYAKKYLLLGLVGGWADEDDDGQQAQEPAKAQAKPAGKKDRSLEIEQAAKHQIDSAKTADEVQKVLGLVKLRVSERVAHADVLKRVTAYAESKEESNGQSE
jgi:hypothetical protein